MRIAIDAGHGLGNSAVGHFDPGAVSGGACEADVVLEYAIALMSAVVSAGWTPIMTRINDTTPCPLIGRVRTARDAGADMLISLHCNAAESETATGTETLYNATDGLARKLQGAVVSTLGLRDRGVKQRGNLAVLKFERPCALVELGFVTNRWDRAVLLDPTARRRTAEAICRALA